MSLEKKLQECQRDIQTIFGRDFPQTDISQTFYWPAVSVAKHDIEWTIWHYAKVSLKQLFNDRNKYHLNQHQQAQLLFFNNSDRIDHVEMFQKAVSCAPLADVVQVEVTPKRIASLPDILRRSRQLLRWCAKKAGSSLTWKEFWFLVPFVQLAVEAKRQFSSWPLEQYKAVVMFQDFNWISDNLRQIAEQQGIFTVSLQHGVPLVHNVFPEEGEDITARMSNADRLLVWSELNEIRAKEAGVPAQNIVVCGNLRYIGHSRLQMNRAERKGAFIVILSLVRYENIRLTQIAVELAKSTGWKFYLRYHPLEQGNEYDEYCKTEYYLGNAGKYSMEQCQTAADFFLVGCSSMLLDVLAYGSRVYHYHDERGYGAFPVKECAFSSSEDVVRAESDLEKTEKDWVILQTKLLGPVDAETRYKSFFDTLNKTL